jgi:AcrR family transcriptional regulator
VTERLSRQERRERTRSHLLDAAGRVFARRGLAHASVDEVAADAGFTKGAVYANFRSKEELFLAMLDARLDRRLDEMDRILGASTSAEQGARAAAEDFIAYLKSDPEWERLFFEAALHAARDEAFGRRLAASYAAMRERMAAILRVRGEQLGLRPPVGYEELATMIFAMGNGVAFERLVEPAAVPDGLFATMLELFTRGLSANTPGEGPR